MPDWKLIFEHADPSPAKTGRLPYLIHPPSIMSASAAWIRFRDLTLLPMMAAKPDDPDLPNFLDCVERVLAWRSGIAIEDRFWKAD